MNKAVLMGRLVRDPDVRYTQGERSMAIARFTLAVDRKFKRENEQGADFINCVAFGKGAAFTEKYFSKGMRVVVSGRLQTGSYTNKDGQKVYTMDVIVEEQEFAESRKRDKQSDSGNSGLEDSSGDGFMQISDDEESGLPFN